MRVYLSGPMKGYPDSNFPAFHATAAALRARGLEVVNPAEIGVSTAENDPVCPCCGGDGMDPMTDYALPCPECGYGE